jgi:phosphate:Na+ symporter
MTELRLLLELAGEAALLLWGLHMVQSGVIRAFGSRLRHALGLALGDRLRAFAAGLGVTAALQSCTATALMVSSFAASGAVGLAPALAAMLGANLGTALIVQLLSFDAAAAFPTLVLAGVLAFRRGQRARTRDLGRVAIGLGLMLLALHLMLGSMAPVEASPPCAPCWPPLRTSRCRTCCWPRRWPGRRIPAWPACSSSPRWPAAGWRARRRPLPWCSAPISAAR